MAFFQRFFIVLIPLLFIVLLSSFGLQAEPKEGFQKGSITLQGHERTFKYYIPNSYSSGKPVPLLFSFHGRGSHAEKQIQLTNFDQLAEKEGFIAVFPNSAEINEPNLKSGHERQWNDGRFDTPVNRAGIDDVKFTSEMIDYFARHYNVDLDRVYATGMSNGAYFVNRLAIELSDRLAGIGAVAGTIATPIATQKPRSPVPVVLMMGTDDPIVPYEGVSGYSLSAEETVDYWKNANALDAKPSTKTLGQLDKTDKTKVIRKKYKQAGQQAEVTFYKVIDGGHTWPGGPQYAKPSKVGLTSKQLEASKVIWNELKKFKRGNL